VSTKSTWNFVEEVFPGNFELFCDLFLEKETPQANKKRKKSFGGTASRFKWHMTVLVIIGFGKYFQSLIFSAGNVFWRPNFMDTE
jgi:hypothetical protein